eukprot:TRINITY_DN3000_c0_g1_i2.p1 TRINITY_DN3000_c0_g1~~TRINITY_DN3000_c0_g1_i2.p1  ORF type:complete len:124 (+),score=44.50 TRINITY_DN3000_c0_g1_i2:283-654(+)
MSYFKDLEAFLLKINENSLEKEQKISVDMIQKVNSQLIEITEIEKIVRNKIDNLYTLNEENQLILEGGIEKSAKSVDEVMAKIYETLNQTRIELQNCFAYDDRMNCDDPKSNNCETDDVLSLS